ncbi:MAG TPA: hypothetical protein VD838_02000 [Anaeromyxobacteraceae bacterium]|nr:hypothetical protein [Anaeromyxobacteraceae bacterium]
MAGRDGWSDAVEWDDAPTPLPAPPAAAPKPVASGKARRTIEVMCCPACESFRVGRVDWRAGGAIAYWRCRECGIRWKESLAVGEAQRRAVLP